MSVGRDIGGTSIEYGRGRLMPVSLHGPLGSSIAIDMCESTERATAAPPFIASLKASSEPLPSPLASSSWACAIFVAYTSASAARAALAAAGLMDCAELVGRSLGGVVLTTVGGVGGWSTYNHTAYAPRLNADSKSNTEIARPVRDSGRNDVTGAALVVSNGSGACGGAGLFGLGGARSVMGPQ